MKQFAYMETSTISTINGTGLLKGTYNIREHTCTNSELRLRESKVEWVGEYSSSSFYSWQSGYGQLIKADVWFFTNIRYFSMLVVILVPSRKHQEQPWLGQSQCLGVIFRGVLKAGLLAVNYYQLNVSCNVNMKPWSNYKNGQVWVDSWFGMMAYKSRCEIRLK